jgi:uncharacterized repeat protein (TIGR03803 family)
MKTVLRRVRMVAAVPIALMLAPMHSTSAYTLKTLHPFCKWTACADGEQPVNLTMVMDEFFNLYGTTASGGRYGSGVVFELVRDPNTGSYKERVLHNFCAKQNCTDGGKPWGELIMDANGNLYGTTSFGGDANGFGSIYELAHTQNGWAYMRLASFNSQNGGSPFSGLTYRGQWLNQRYDGSSPLFGVTPEGGAHNSGTAYELATSDGVHWSLTDIHDFDSSGGGIGLMMDGSGDLFGTALGGKYGQGTLYRLTNGNGQWTATVLHNFCSSQNCADGAQPSGRLLIDPSTGNLFGETTFGGAYGGSACSGGSPQGCGVVFERTTGGAFKVLYSFCAVPPDCSDGAEPYQSALTMDAFGNLFGMTTRGGDHHGTAFELSPVKGGWTETVLHTFCRTDCSDGDTPEGSFIQDDSGDLFGTTLHGGPNGDHGTVFELRY